MDISGYTSGITANIINQTLPFTISPATIGNAFNTLANLTKTNVESKLDISGSTLFITGITSTQVTNALGFTPSQVTVGSSTGSINLQNPANILLNTYVQTSASFNLITFSGVTYYSSVSGNTTYTIGGYISPSSTLSLNLRFEDINGNSLSGVTLNNIAPTVFTTPSACTKIYYSVQRYDNTSNTKPYNNVMLLAGDQSANYPAYAPYLSNVNSINNKNIEAQYLTNGIVVTPMTGDTYVVTQKQLRDKGYGVPTITTSINLQNPVNQITGQWITPNDGSYVTLTGAVLLYSPVTPGNIYTLSGYHHPNFAGGQPVSIRFEDASNAKISYAILPSGETPYTFTAQTNCTRVVYGVFRTSFPQPYSQIQLETGNTANVYVPFSFPVVTAINGYMISGATGASSSTGDTLTILNSDKIVFAGCSYIEAAGVAVKNKAIVNRVAALTNYQVYNYSQGGDRLVDITDRLRKNTPTQFTSRGFGIRDINPTYITVQNIGNETLNSGISDSDLFKEELKEVSETILASGAKPIYSNDYFIKNSFLSNIFKTVADEYGAYYHEQGVLGEKIITQGVPAIRFWGTHPDTRAISYNVNEWTYLFNKAIPNPKKSIKGFRKIGELAINSIQDLNYDTIQQRSSKWSELTVGHYGLTESNEANGWGYMDKISGATSYTKGTAYTDEYLELMSKNAVSFTDFALWDLTLDKINNTSATIYIQMPQSGATKFWLKDYFNSADYAFPAKSNQSIILTVDKTTYTGTSITIGDIYTSSQVLNGTGGTISLIAKGKFYSPTTGYIIGFETLNQAQPSTIVYDTTGTTTLATTGSTGSTTINYSKINSTLTRHSFAFLSTYGKPEGSFANVTSAATYNNGYYQLTLSASDLKRYVNYDNLKLVVDLSGNTFSISDIYVQYNGGVEKKNKKVGYSPKLSFTEKISDNTFDSGWTGSGRWSNSGATLVSRSSINRDYPSLISPAINHIELGYDADGNPNKVFRTINVTAKTGTRKAVVRVNAELFPKLYRTDLTPDSETTNTRQIKADSYDAGTVCLGIKGNNIVNILKQRVEIGWTDVYFEFDIPPFQSTFELSIFRDVLDVIDPVNYRNHLYPLCVCWVSCQIEGE
ncbi:hypothetical protein [Mucilaginibacter kameinonensis]|uniref:hypothetical protein n=1 Tax=Mucilaginibacter kameinonensis TaxID=452286 RepID=UPI000EF77123|nr:hypothetical protein [Mucilaginibacter kameinonensis]